MDTIKPNYESFVSLRFFVLAVLSSDVTFVEMSATAWDIELLESAKDYSVVSSE